MSQTRLIAGAMSGTSADGVDIAITRIEGAGVDLSACLVLHHHRPFDHHLRQRIAAARSGDPIRLSELASLGREISLVYAAAVNEALVSAKLAAADLAAVAAHGQTLFHDPPLTLQWLDPALLASEVGCPVVSDFRRADCAVGGQGAPLVPFADWLLFRSAAKNRVLVNLGGIANLSFLPAGAGLGAVHAFDTGPGNCISDWLARRFDPRGPGVDTDGQRASRGRPIRPVVDAMLKRNYFDRLPPKSTDGPAMVEAFRSSFDGALGDHKTDDLLATACAITAESLALALHRFIPEKPDQVILSGGGIRNAMMMRLIAEQLAPTPLLTTDDLGIRSDAKEAIAFALLGSATLDRLPANIVNATGARRAVVLGCITPKP